MRDSFPSKGQTLRCCSRLICVFNDALRQTNFYKWKLTWLTLYSPRTALFTFKSIKRPVTENQHNFRWVPLSDASFYSALPLRLPCFHQVMVLNPGDHFPKRCKLLFPSLQNACLWLSHAGMLRQSRKKKKTVQNLGPAFLEFFVLFLIAELEA